MSEFEPDTIVRSKLTGTFGKIVKRCHCGSGKLPIHYEVLIEGKVEGQFHVIVFNHSDLDLECLPIQADQ